MFLEFNENTNTTYQNLWDTAKAVLIGKLGKISNNLMLHLQILEKQEQVKSKTSRRRVIMKIRPEINKIETKKS
jgi:hypothetical protein